MVLSVFMQGHILLEGAAFGLRIVAVAYLVKYFGTWRVDIGAFGTSYLILAMAAASFSSLYWRLTGLMSAFLQCFTGKCTIVLGRTTLIFHVLLPSICLMTVEVLLFSGAKASLGIADPMVAFMYQVMCVSSILYLFHYSFKMFAILTQVCCACENSRGMRLNGHHEKTSQASTSDDDSSTPEDVDNGESGGKQMSAARPYLPVVRFSRRDNFLA